VNDLSLTPDATAASESEIDGIESDLGIVDGTCDPVLSTCTAPPQP
jgi:hypothetical protein